VAEMMGVSRSCSQRGAEPTSWLRRLFLAWWRPRDGHPRRIDEQAWSGYMLRDIGLDDARGLDPRDVSYGWPLR